MTYASRRLPHDDGRLFLTDGGIETYFVFQEGRALPCFAAFDLLRTDDGRAALVAYYERYIDIARRNGAGFVLESPTWRASADWAARMGLDDAELAGLNADAIAMLTSLRRKHETGNTPMLVSGCVGPRGDGYRPDTAMTAREAEAYHAVQIRVFADAGVDMISAITMTTAEEAAGVANAAATARLPCVISFTVETDGALPDGRALAEAIAAVDAATVAAPAYYMLNCAHPSHFEAVLAGGGAWRDRIRGLRCNASAKSHAELDAATELDDGDPAAFGGDHARLLALLPGLSVFGGCCGTDHRHVDETCRQVRQAAPRRRAAE